MTLNDSKFNRDWNIKKLNQLGEFKRGKSKHRPRNDEALFVGGKYPLIQTGEIKEANLYIRKHTDMYNDFGLKQSKLWRENTLCITIAANIAETALLGYPMCFPDSVVGFNAYPKESSELFMHYVFTYVKKAIQNSASGSIQDNINIEYLTGLTLRIPDKTYQDKIAAVLSALDAKIELNQRINAELESMAKTLYDYWFVQFEFPTPSAPLSLSGHPPKYDREILDNNKNTSVVFGGTEGGYKSAGGKMVWNEALKREIPLGWEVESIEKCCSVIDCLHSPKPDLEFEDERYYLLQLENIRDDGLLDLANKYFVPKNVYEFWTSKIEVAEDDIIITNAGRVAATAQIPKGIKAGIGRNITAIRPNSINSTYLFWAFRGADMKRQIKWNTDTGSFFTSLNVRGIRKLFVVRPPKEIEDKFEAVVKQLRYKRETNNIESQTLTELRDWLLPMLMNGQVKI